jgi:hypothetical protein
MPDKLALIIQESGLEKSKAQVLLENFKDYFEIAAEWEIKAKAIVVTSADQVAEMQMARAGRLFLREKRLHIERTRKALKEQALREGRAIDGIANVIKALIVPIEEYLEEQEKFIEIQAAHKAELARIEAEKKAEREERAREEAERRRQRRIAAENERLRIAAKKQDRRLQAERRKREADRRRAEAEKAALEDKALREKEELERKARLEKQKQIKILEDQRTELAAERKKRDRAQAQKREARAELAARMKKEREARASFLKVEEKKRKDLEAKLEKERLGRQAATVTCPFCHKQFVPTKIEVEHAGAI